jgi:N-acetylornithine carbamoyltransferase
LLPSAGKGVALRHFISSQDWSVGELQALLDDATRLKSGPSRPRLQGKTVALLFLNPSLRTRASFQIGAAQLGATAIVLEPGNGVWGIEFDSGKVMDGKAEEHIVEVAKVLSRYCDLIAMRAFPGFQNWHYDRDDPLIKALVQYASVPVINMETIIHPCQELALAMTLQEKLGPLKGKKLCLAWTWNPQPLSTAVANSVTMIATKFGMDVSLLCPNPDYVLDERFMKAGHENARASGGRLVVTHDIRDGYSGADVVYANSWGALPYYANPENEWARSRSYQGFVVDQKKMAMTNGAIFSHCLPVRRNVEVVDAVVDGPRWAAIDEAENRLHVQKALMLSLLHENGHAG